MKASIWKMSALIIAVAVVASGQTANVNHSGMAAVNDGQNLTTDPVTTTRDAQGIWFIEGGDLYDVYEAMGYAAAKDRLWQMDLLRRQGRGKLAALLGPGLLPTDVFIRTIMYSEDEFAAEFDALSDDAKTALQAYVDGVNRRIGEFYAGDWLSMPYEYWLLGLQSVLRGPGLPVLPETFTVADLLGWTAMFFRNFDPEALNMGQLDNGILVQTLLAAYGDQRRAEPHHRPGDHDPRCPGHLVHRGWHAVRGFRGNRVCRRHGPIVANGHLPAPGTRAALRTPGCGDDLERRFSSHDRLLGRRVRHDVQRALGGCTDRRHRLYGRHQPAHLRVLRGQLDADALRVLVAGPAIGVTWSRSPGASGSHGNSTTYWPR